MNIKEESPITTTDNGGNVLEDPKLPIKSNNMVRRVMDLSKSRKNKKLPCQLKTDND